MRKMAFIQPARRGICRAVLYDDGNGAWLFLYDSLDDGPCRKDYWFEEREDAEDWCQDELGIEPSDWRDLPDPPPGQAPHLVESENDPGEAGRWAARGRSALRDEVRRCALTMSEQAGFIRRELGAVRMPDACRRRVERTCAELLGTKFDVISEIAEWDEVPERERLERVERVLRWLSESAGELDDLARELRVASEAGSAERSASVLVMESAGCILESLGRVEALAARLQADEGQ